MLDTVELQKKLGAAILEVQVKVHFVQLTNNNRGFLGRLYSTASVDSKVFPRISSAMMRVQSAATRGRLTLRDEMRHGRPAKYRDVVGSGLGAVREMFVARVKAGK